MHWLIVWNEGVDVDVLNFNWYFFKNINTIDMGEYKHMNLNPP